MIDLNKRRIHEKKIIAQMISLYCKKNHKNNELCYECAQLQKYVNERIDKCPYMKTKSFCSQCPTPCYSKERRAQIKKVMRFSGPRMLFYHPLVTISHGYHTLIGK